MKPLPSFWHFFLGQPATGAAVSMTSRNSYSFWFIATSFLWLFYFLKFSSVATRSITQLFVWLFLCFFLFISSSEVAAWSLFLCVCEWEIWKELTIVVICAVTPSAISFWMLYGVYMDFSDVCCFPWALAYSPVLCSEVKMHHHLGFLEAFWSPFSVHGARYPEGGVPIARILSQMNPNFAAMYVVNDLLDMWLISIFYFDQMWISL